jgi:hypothetical protein
MVARIGVTNLNELLLTSSLLDLDESYSASGVGLSAGGATWKELAVMQVVEKLPVIATSATRSGRPIAASAAA